MSEPFSLSTQIAETAALHCGSNVVYIFLFAFVCQLGTDLRQCLKAWLVRLLVLLSTISTKLYSNARAASFDSVRTGVFKPDSPLHGLILLFLQNHLKL
jgi:hypothetical protein